MLRGVTKTRLFFKTLRDAVEQRMHDAKVNAEASEDALDEAKIASAKSVAGLVQGVAGGHGDEEAATSQWLNSASMLSATTRTRWKDIEPKQLIAPRSALFVPCSNAKALAKVKTLCRSTDVFILDLEDSVAPAAKHDARENLTRLASSGAFEGARCIVRINSPRTDPANGVLDLECVAGIRDVVEGVGVPKVELDDAALFTEYLSPGHTAWAFFETPRAILDADRILKSAVYQFAVMGLNDLSNELNLPLGLSGARVQHYYSMSAVIMAARAHGVIPLDGVFNDPTDTAGLKNELLEAKRFGFDGKTLIHPAQVPHCNETFTPSEKEVQWARRIVAAVAEARGGVAVVDGKMVEDLHARQAQRLLIRYALSAASTFTARSEAPTTSTSTSTGGNKQEGAPPSQTPI